jgi:inositol-hexakisphosphate kinase
MSSHDSADDYVSVSSVTPVVSRSQSPIQLEPFVHQVGGHFPIVCLDGTTVCKPLNDREHRFYKTMANGLKPFAPAFEGTMKVETAEDEDGYITLRGQPPPHYCRAATGAGGVGKNRRPSLHYRLKRRESIEIEPIKEDDLQLASFGDLATSPSKRSASASVDSMADEDTFYNPWALKCHRDHLKKLGMLRPYQSNFSGGDATSSEESGAVQNPKKGHGDGNSGSSRPNPQTYLLLENLVCKYRRPCIMDMKVGARQYADDSSAAKKQRKMVKAAATTSGSLGLRVCGMQVYKAETGSYVCHNKYFGRALDNRGLKGALVEYLNGGGGDGLRSDVLDCLVVKLTELREVLDGLDSYRDGIHQP